MQTQKQKTKTATVARPPTPSTSTISSHIPKSSQSVQDHDESGQMAVDLTVPVDTTNTSQDNAAMQLDDESLTAKRIDKGKEKDTGEKEGENEEGEKGETNQAGQEAQDDASDQPERTPIEEVNWLAECSKPSKLSKLSKPSKTRLAVDLTDVNLGKYDTGTLLQAAVWRIIQDESGGKDEERSRLKEKVKALEARVGKLKADLKLEKRKRRVLGDCVDDLKARQREESDERGSSAMDGKDLEEEGPARIWRRRVLQGFGGGGSCKEEG
ncbi:hypothetical protein DL96DRAFT_1721327 [Flagelloscypha sp. PMI_526]|nr:hypothetical protein DL96DRAFT_1721327 [Flagelloscypha sp. PMI_526]